MIVEYIRYYIPLDQQAAFESAYVSAQQALAGSPHCLAYELAHCAEDPTAYVLRIEWDSLEGHLAGFRRSAAFRTFFQAIGPYVNHICEMRHYRSTGIEGSKR